MAIILIFFALSTASEITCYSDYDCINGFACDTINQLCYESCTTYSGCTTDYYCGYYDNLCYSGTATICTGDYDCDTNYKCYSGSCYYDGTGVVVTVSGVLWFCYIGIPIILVGGLIGGIIGCVRRCRRIQYVNGGPKTVVVTTTKQPMMQQLVMQ